ncbi:MAG: hypothetical protein ACHQ49_09810 [Elusimicrobiota bacterium]
MRRLILPFALALAAGGVAARAADAGDDAWKKEMENKIDVLTQELESAKLAPGAAAGAGAPAAAPIALSPYSFGPAAGKVYGVDRGIAFGGYGELIYQNFAHATAGSLNGDESQPRSAEFDLARWVLYTGYRFTDNIVFNSELEVEDANSSKSGEVEAEFAYLDFALSKPFGVRVGELLLPVGLTNEYHEPVVFHGALRPDVEEYLIPTTWHENGAGYYGQYGPFAYRGCVVAALRAAADGSMNQIGFQPDIGIHEGQQEGSRSRAHDLAYAQRLDYTGLPGWAFGASMYYGNTGQGDETPSGRRIDAPLTLWDAHVRGEWKGWETRVLYTQTTIGGVDAIDQANGLTGNASVGSYLWGGYAELSYNVLGVLAPASAQYVSPFFRYERYDTQAKVPSGYQRNLANDRTVYTMGVSYKPIPRVVLKADYQVRTNHAGTGVNQFNMAAGYEF